MSREDDLFELLEPVVAERGVDLVEVGTGRSGARELLRLVIHGSRGVSHEDCTRVTRAAYAALEASGMLAGSFALEVTSPGLDRVFKHPREFEIFRGRPVRVWMHEADDVLAGVASGLTDGEPVVLDENGVPTQLAWSAVKKARLAFNESQGLGGKR
jgi:ribosome maturation factor RimP